MRRLANNLSFTICLVLGVCACSGGDAEPATSAPNTSGTGTSGAPSSTATNGATTSATLGTGTPVSGTSGFTMTSTAATGGVVTGSSSLQSASTGAVTSSTGVVSSTSAGSEGSTATAATTTGAESTASASTGTGTSTSVSTSVATTGAGGAATSTSDTSTVTSSVTTGDAVTTSASTGGPPTEPVTLYLAGDSIVQTYADTASTGDQAGWGQMFAAYFVELVTVDNRAIGGRTARRFIDEGRLQDIADDLQAGDYLFVQFGTNDSNQNASAVYTLNGQTIPYYVDPETFKTYLLQYIDVARDRSATPVLVTPTPRNSAYCTGGNGTGAYAQAMRELASAEGVALSDLNAKTVTYLTAICPAPTPEDFFFLRTDGTVDGTHFQENGARILASFVAEGVADANLPLAQYLK